MNTRTAEQNNVETLLKELDDLNGLMTKSQAAAEQQYKDLSTHYDGLKKDNGELSETVKKHVAEYAEMVTSVQQLKSSIEMVKKELEAPVFRSEKDLNEADRAAAVELQRRSFVWKGGDVDQFTPEMDKLVNLADYRSACRKLVAKGGLEKRSDIVRTFTQAETKAFEAANLDTAFFSPEILGLTVDCNIECAGLLDLYGQVSVSRSKFMYPAVEDYGAIGSYQCDVDCDADLGPEGNIKYLNGKTYDFRGVFCFLRKVLEEANYDFLAFMMLSAQRSQRINRNRVLMVGDGENEPEGWLTADTFTKLKTAPGTFNHVDFRRFLASAPVEYGEVAAVMHQNMFAYLASATDSTGRFIFGDGDISFSPDNTSERIRISNCLPDATENNTLGSEAAPFVSGSFISAAGNWDKAYKAVSKKPLSIEQFIGGSGKWCVKYQFGAEDGGFVACAPAARTLFVG